MAYIIFYLPDNEAAQRVIKLFYYIASIKNKALQIDDLEYIIIEKQNDFFTKKEFESFWWPTPRENRLFWEHYQSLSGEEQAQFLQSVPWDFETVFDAIGQGEYTIEGVTTLGGSIYRLSLEPVSYPFGGLEPIEGLLQIYGAVIQDIYS